jgi:hypothetical protein
MPDTTTLPTYAINPDSLEITLFMSEEKELSYLPDLWLNDQSGEFGFTVSVLSWRNGLEASKMTSEEKRHANLLMTRRIGLALKLMHEMEKAGIINPANFTNANSISVRLTGHPELAPSCLSL